MNIWKHREWGSDKIKGNDFFGRELRDIWPEENNVILNTPRWHWEDQYEKSGAWWLETTVDVFNCDPDIIRSSEDIKRYVRELCDLIDMKRFQDTQVVHFGEDEKVAGFSMTQLIETSLISGHFANKTNTSYINAFSCKYYDPLTVAEFTKEYFRWKYYKLNINLRDSI